MFIFEDKAILAYCIVMALIIGAVFGSFLSCMASRISRKEDFVKERSHCMFCNHVLGAADLVPVFSYIFSKGQCRYCKKKLPWTYPASEIFFALVCLGILMKDGLTVHCLRDFIIACCLYVLSLVDLEIMEIPDPALIIAAAAWIVDWIITRDGNIVHHILSGFGYGLAVYLISWLMDVILKKESMGGGDIKLFALMGLCLGPVCSLFAVILSCFVGLILVYAGRIRKPEDEGYFPFGPSIAIAFFAMLLWGEPLVRWYLSLFILE